MGQPIIEVHNANYENRGELFMIHKTEGLGLDFQKAQQVLENIFHIWTRPVYIRSVMGNDSVILSYNGKELKMIKI